MRTSPLVTSAAVHAVEPCLDQTAVMSSCAGRLAAFGTGDLALQSWGGAAL